jgi:hypothetical protein
MSRGNRHGIHSRDACCKGRAKRQRRKICDSLFFGVRTSHMTSDVMGSMLGVPLKVVERLDLPGTPVVRVRFHLLGDTPHQQVAAGGFSRTLPHKPLSTSHFFQAYGYECRQSEDKRLRRTIEDIVLCERASLFSIASSSGVHLIVDTLSFLHCQDIQRSRLLSWTGFGYHARDGKPHQFTH